MRIGWIAMWIVLAVILLIAAAPLISVLIAGWIADANGCALDEGSIHPCMVNGEDIGGMLYTLGVMGWFMLVTIPLGGLAVVVWLIVAAILFFIGRRKAASAPGRP